VVGGGQSGILVAASVGWGRGGEGGVGSGLAGTSSLIGVYL
jgi:hypothetical protein